MKPGGRSEFDWSETPYPETVMGRVDDSVPAGGDRPVGKLYLPDPEARRAWREFYVPAKAPTNQGRPIGFGRVEGGTR